MKAFLKCVGLLVVGLFVAIIVYPFLHEGGHWIIALMVGAEIKEFSLFPLPFVMCEVSAVDNMGKALIGLGGIIVPFFISMGSRPKNFWVWYGSLLLRGISVYATILSFVAVIFHINGISWQNEDIVQVLRIFPNGTWLFLFAFIFMCVYGIIQIIKEKPLSRCLNHFETSSRIAI